MKMEDGIVAQLNLTSFLILCDPNHYKEVIKFVGISLEQCTRGSKEEMEIVLETVKETFNIKDSRASLLEDIILQIVRGVPCLSYAQVSKSFFILLTI